MKKIAINISALFLSASAYAQTVVYTNTDASLNSGNLTFEEKVLTGTAGASSNMTLNSLASGGNSGANSGIGGQISVNGQTPNTSQVRNYYSRDNWTYDPSVLAPTDTLSFYGSLDKIDVSPQRILIGVYAEQGGVRYEAFSDTNTGADIWTTFNNTIANQGLSTSGGVITLGMIAGIQHTVTASEESQKVKTVNLASSGIGLDNLVVRIEATSAPEPSSTALLGLGALGFIVRRKRA